MFLCHLFQVSDNAPLEVLVGPVGGLDPISQDLASSGCLRIT